MAPGMMFFGPPDNGQRDRNDWRIHETRSYEYNIRSKPPTMPETPPAMALALVLSLDVRLC